MSSDLSNQDGITSLILRVEQKKQNKVIIAILLTLFFNLHLCFTFIATCYNLLVGTLACGRSCRQALEQTG